MHILAAILLLSAVAAQKPHTNPDQPVQAKAWVPADVGMDACPAFTHLHALGTAFPDDPKYQGDGKCHDDDTDAPMLTDPDRERAFVLPRGTKKMKPSSKVSPPVLQPR